MLGSHRLLVGFALLFVCAAPTLAQSVVSGSGSVLYTHATTLEYDGYALAGASFSVAGDLVVTDRWVGRVQFDALQPATLTGDDAEHVTGGFALVGSLGVRFAIGSRVSVDLLGHAGYAQLSYTNNGIDFMDASPQVGAGIAPHIRLTNRLAVTLSLRSLVGSDIGEGTAINRTDIGIGGRLRVF